MSAARGGLTRKQMKQDQLVEAATDFGEWLEDNWKTVLRWACAIVALAVVVMAWYYIDKARKAEAQDVLGKAYKEFFAAEGNLAGIEGTYAAAIELFEETSDKAGSTATGSIAEFYKGVAHLRTGETEEGIRILEAVREDAREPLLIESALLSLSHAYAETGEHSRAAELLHSLADGTETFYPPDMALVIAGKVLAEGGDQEGARDSWNSAIERFPDSSGAAEARRLLEE